jgi:hypothetical protein
MPFDGSRQVAYQARISSLENSLGTSLPRSYQDFLAVFQPSQPSKLEGRMFFSPEDVVLLREAFPDALSAAEKWQIESNDEEYYVYGVEQDDSSGRLSNLRSAIVVGRFGSSPYELVILYPSSRTKDDEMEAALLFHSGEFRAPSFAELMRQLSYKETMRPSRVPPYPQDLLSKSCAGKLALKSIWWK